MVKLPEKSPESPFSQKVTIAASIVTVVTALVGAAGWAVAYFATKQELNATKQQLKEVQCIANADMAFLQARMDSANLSQLLVDNIKDRAALEKPNLSGDEIIKRNQLMATGDQIAKKLADADNAAAKALDGLKKGECIPQ
jgi:hypothetical protein